MKHRKFRLVLCDDLERWGVGVVGGREVQQRGDMGILTADSLHSTAETNATLKAIILQFKKKTIQESHSFRSNAPGSWGAGLCGSEADRWEKAEKHA